MKSVRYGLLYQFFASQIRFGALACGDALPSIELLRRIYHAAPETVRNAYLQLQTDGYVRMEPGRGTIVVYKAGREACARDAMDYYLARRDAISSLHEALRVLLLPMLREGCRRLTPQDLRQIRNMAVKLEDGDFYVSFFCGRAMVLAFQNRLALDLFNTAVSFCQFPHALPRREAAAQAQREEYRALSARAVAACERGEREGLFDVYLKIQRLVNEILWGFLARAQRERPLPPQVPFEWRVYRQRPQLCYSLAARLIEEIYVAGSIPAGDLLPSYSAMTERFSVSMSTVRRTVELLEQLGVCAPIHGVGTRALPLAPNPEVLGRPAAQTMLRMFLEVMQGLGMSFPGIVESFLPQLRQQAPRLIAALKAQQGSEHQFTLFFICMDFLLHGSGNRPLGEIWHRLCEVLLLGLPLLEAQPGSPPGAGAACRQRLIRSLEAGDDQAFREELDALRRSAHTAALAAAQPLEGL